MPLTPGQTVLWPTTWTRPAWCREDWILVQLPQGNHGYLPLSKVELIDVFQGDQLCWIQVIAKGYSVSISIPHCVGDKYGYVDIDDIRIPEHEEPSK